LVISVSSEPVLESASGGPVCCSVKVTAATQNLALEAKDGRLINRPLQLGNRNKISIPCVGFDPILRLIINDSYMNTSSSGFTHSGLGYVEAETVVCPVV